MQDGLFAPNKTTTRAEFVTMLVRAMNWIDAGEGIDFRDVSAEDWFAVEIRTASNKGVITGDGLLFFHPNKPITREEMAVIIIRVWRMLSVAGLPSLDGVKLSSVDRAMISEWAEEAVLQANKLGLLQGKAEDRLAPHELANRAEAAVVINRLLHALSN
ncbi:Endoglucanase precursor [compost metagenome]